MTLQWISGENTLDTHEIIERIIKSLIFYKTSEGTI